MLRSNSYGKMLMIIAMLAVGIQSASAVDNPGQGRSLMVKFPAFSLNPGEKIAGITVKTSQGQLTSSCLPGRWRCDRQGDALHCYCLHQSHAIALTGLLPELYIRNIPPRATQISVEATVEFLNSDGKEFSREFREGELIFK